MARVETSEDTLSRLVRGFEDWLTVTQESRDEAELARDYYDGKQWTEEEQATFRLRKQPIITDNMLKDKVEYCIGLELATRTDPKAYPRNPADEEAAEAATDALRYIWDKSDAQQVKSDIAENMFVEGFGGAEVYFRSGEVTIKRNRWERCYFDPHSSEKNYADATYLGTFVWMDLEDAEAKWPDAEFWDIVSAHASGQDSDSDRPRENFIDRSRKRVRILETYCRHKGQWYRALWTYAGVIEYAVSSWLDEDGEPEHPYCWMSAYVDRNNNRYGVVRRYKSLQDEINHRRSKALHLLNTNRIVMEEGAVEDVEQIRREAAKPDGVLVRRQGFEFDILTNNEMAAGQTALLQDARNALAVTGPKAMSNSSPSQSGRAKEIDRQSDVLELGRLFDQLRHWQKAVNRKSWNRVKQFWTEEKWIRVTDDESRVKFVALNQPITAQEAVEEAIKSGQMPHPQLEFMAPDAIVGKRNDVSKLDVDIVIDEAPDVVTLQQEQFTNLVDLARAGVTFPPEIYVEASGLRNKQALLEKLKGGEDPAMLEQQEKQQELQERGANAQVAESEAKAAKTQAEAEQTRIENMAGMAGLHGLATNGPPPNPMM